MRPFTTHVLDRLVAAFRWRPEALVLEAAFAPQSSEITRR